MSSEALITVDRGSCAFMGPGPEIHGPDKRSVPVPGKNKHGHAFMSTTRSAPSLGLTLSTKKPLASTILEVEPYLLDVWERKVETGSAPPGGKPRVKRELVHFGATLPRNSSPPTGPSLGNRTGAFFLTSPGNMASTSPPDCMTGNAASRQSRVMTGTKRIATADANATAKLLT